MYSIAFHFLVIGVFKDSETDEDDSDNEHHKATGILNTHKYGALKIKSRNGNKNTPVRSI